MIRKGQAVVSTAQKNPKVINERLFIGTLGVNCLEYTRRCIDTVVTSCEKVRFVYIDNGSKPESVEELKTWRKKNDDIDYFQMGFNGFNAGVAVGWNQLIKMALDWDATKILICNNDIAFGPKTIDGLVEAYNRLRNEIPETVMVTATNHTKNPNELLKIKQEWKYHEHPDFSCYMITPETIDRIGFFPEEYKPAFFEDNATHHKILLQGYKAFGTDWAPYSHIASRTRYGNPDIVTHFMFRLNKLRFFNEFMTDTCDQEVADARYACWIAQNPAIKHPNYKQVIEFCIGLGFIKPEFVASIRKLTKEDVE